MEADYSVAFGSATCCLGSGRGAQRGESADHHSRRWARLAQLPLGGALTALALGEGLISRESLVLALTIAVVFHTAEVSQNVFKRW